MENLSPTTRKFDKVINETLTQQKENLAKLSSNIWNKPELKFEEHYAHDVLTEFLECNGFSVERKYILDTAFRAQFERKSKDTKDVVSGVVMCEYDALPIMGHACGHNLIAEVGVACSIAVKSVMEKHNIFGKIVVIGTPGEERGGGKIYLIKGGAFKNSDFALMAHPGVLDNAGPQYSAALEIGAHFKGVESHAGLAPWDGVNALDASVACYNNISLLRQQLTTDSRINIAIRDCGHGLNVIPKDSKMQFLIRTGLTCDIEKLKKKVLNCVESAAIATGCESTIDINEYHSLKHIMHNSVIEGRYAAHGKDNGINFPPNIKRGAATDCGNVSHELPTLHPIFRIGTESNTHSAPFATAANSPIAQPFALRTAKLLALTFLDFLTDPNLVRLAKAEFQDAVNHQ